MERIAHIADGEDMASVRQKVNILIDFINANFPLTRSYNDLHDKPAIDGSELNSETLMSMFSIPISSLPCAIDLQELFINTAKAQAELIAREVARTVIQESNNPAGIPNAGGFIEDDWKVQVWIRQQDRTMLPYLTTMQEIIQKAVWAVNRQQASVNNV